MAKWFVKSKRADFNAIGQKYNIDPVVARLLVNRDITEDEDIRAFLFGTLSDLHDPHELKDMDKAVSVIEAALINEKHIRIIGDYDIDGVTSTYILKEGLSLYAKNKLGKSEDRIIIDCVIPDRMKDGYGMNDGMIRLAKEDGVDLIVTCDNGISAYNQIELAISLGIDVVVTDHHEVPYTEEGGLRYEVIPRALAVVDPKQADCKYPFKGICGGMVAWKLIQALFEDLCLSFLPFAALATIGDVMELRDENRIVVKEGLKAFRTTDNVGLKALIHTCGVKPEDIDVFTVGFVLGPCINATGRLDTAYRALELFTEENVVVAGSIAVELKQLNDERKLMTNKFTELAINKLNEMPVLPQVIALYLPDCHESLAGIIAGRIRERFYRPTFIMTDGKDGLKGSGRSIPAYHMYEHLHEVEHLLSKYGGHALAAGFSLAKENYEEFARLLNENAHLSEEDLTEIVSIDMAMPFSYASEKLVRDIQILEPFGTGNPQPVFAQKKVRFCSAQRLGPHKNVAKFKIRDESGRGYEMINFRNNDSLDAFIEENFGALALTKLYDGMGDITLTVAYYPNINEYRGTKSMQYVMLDYTV